MRSIRMCLHSASRIKVEEPTRVVRAITPDRVRFVLVILGTRRFESPTPLFGFDHRKRCDRRTRVQVNSPSLIGCLV